jgi:hypothetical protein
MNAPLFRQRPNPALTFALGARLDLRVGALVAGVVRPRGAQAFAFSSLVRILRAARMTWLKRGYEPALILAVPPGIQNTLAADLLSDAAVESGATRRSLSFELNECEIMARGPALAEGLRARGWRVVLRGDMDCPLPFGARARTLYSEVVIDARAMPDPARALQPRNRTLLGRRLFAAKAAGLILTAETVATATQARTLAIAGFDRVGGPFAEAGLR